MNALKQRFSRARKIIKTERANKNIRKGDIVEIIAGRDAASKKTGKVLKIFTKTNRCIVEKANMVKKHRKPTQQTPGGIDEKEASVHLSNVRLISRGTTEAKATAKKTTAKSETKEKAAPKKKAAAKK